MKSQRHILFLLALIAIIGCRKGPDTQFIEGVVTLDGTPVEKATVNFIPKPVDYDPNDINRPLLASGFTDEKGQYRLSSVMGGNIGGGTTVGEYIVTIVKKEQTNKPVVTSANIPKNINNIRPVFQYIVPEKFEKRETSGVELSVGKGKNRFNFDLKSDGSFEIKP
ncbi:MAG: hypothetical protein ACRCUY_13830 [Thermoguttaceae bacterium]